MKDYPFFGQRNIIARFGDVDLLTISDGGIMKYRIENTNCLQIEGDSYDEIIEKLNAEGRSHIAEKVKKWIKENK